MAKIGVILSGCGVFDGSEIHEAVLTLLCLDQQGLSYQCLAPNKPATVVNHLTQQPAEQTRNVLEESARVARGEILDLAQVNVADYDAFVLPGGFGAAKNLSTFATDGAGCTVDPDVQRVLTAAHATGKPIAFMCIAPAIAARVFGAQQPALTIGHDAGLAKALTQMGARHQTCGVGDIIVDHEQRLLTTPAYLEAKSIKDAYAGISTLIARLATMVRQPSTAPAAAR